ncbi:MAG: S46 family peptidase [Candidatus Eisenbacteria bacterium]
MKLCRFPLLACSVLLSLLILSLWIAAAYAEEGMWLPDAPPGAFLEERYGFSPTPEWLEHLQKSCVKIGASGSFVSPHGLILTNHHVGSGQLEKLSTPERNLVETGFVARSLAEEIPCPDMEVQVLWSHRDVTGRIVSAAGPGMNAAEAEEARRSRMTEVEAEAEAASGLKCQVVKLYRGARYELYEYRRYTDVRLVMAPEKAAAFFGGDADNFEYPRYDFDVCFFRVYDRGKPLEVEYYLRVAPEGAREGDLAFVFGHPGRTNRLCTVGHLRFQRDVEVPATLAWLWRREAQLATFLARSPENARIGEGDYFGVQNSRKSRTGYLAALQDPKLFEAKEAVERDLRSWVDQDSDRGRLWGDAWDQIDGAYRVYRGFFPRYQLLESRAGGRSALFDIARRVVRLAAELPKASTARLREYRDTNLESLWLDLYSPAPIYPVLEADRLASWISYAVETLGGDDPLVRQLLDGKPPAERAAEIVSGTRLADVSFRRSLVEGGAAALADSDDPMLVLAALVDPEARQLRKRYENEVEGVETEAYAKIGAAQFARRGNATYPDATGTLRIAFGPIRGYEEQGREIPAFTHFAGMFERYAEKKGQPGFELPERWLSRRARLRPDTPLNFVCTADIIGGNSGSPVVDRQGRLIGLIFDGNIQSLAWDVAYSDAQARAVAVDVRAILEALRVMYDDGALADEMEGRSR